MHLRLAPFCLTRSCLVLVSIGMVACAHPAPSAPETTGQAVVIAKNAPQVGRVAIEEMSMEMRLSAEVRAKGGVSRVSSVTSQHERRRDEIFAIFDRIVTKKRIVYEQVEKHETRDGAPVAGQQSPIAGRAYWVELRDSSVVFTRANGADVSEDERAELAKRLGNFGKVDPFLEGIPDGPLRPNQPAPGMSEGFLEIFEGGEDGPDVGKVAVNFIGARDHRQGSCAVFAFTLQTQLAGEPRLNLDLHGEFLVRIADGAPIQLDVQGPTRLQGRQKLEGVDVQLDGTGEMHGTWRTRYLPP